MMGTQAHKSTAAAGPCRQRGQSLRDVVRKGRVRDIQRNVYRLMDFPQLIMHIFRKNGVITRGMCAGNLLLAENLILLFPSMFAKGRGNDN